MVQTIQLADHLKTKQVKVNYSDKFFIQMFAIQIPAVLRSKAQRLFFWSIVWTNDRKTYFILNYRPNHFYEINPLAEIHPNWRISNLNNKQLVNQSRRWIGVTNQCGKTTLKQLNNDVIMTQHFFEAKEK